MRIALALVLAALLSAHLYFPISAQQEAVEPIRSVIASTRRELLDERSIEVVSDANGALTEPLLRKLLGSSFNNLDLYMSPELVSAQLQRHPLIEEAAISPCHWSSLRCFRFTLKERTPEYAVVRGGAERVHALLVGSDGGVIAPIRTERLAEPELQLGSRRFDRPRVVVGVPVAGGGEPSHSRFLWVRERVALLEQVTQRRVARVDVDFGVSVRVRFSGVAGEVRLSEPVAAGDPTIELQARRLAAIFQQFGSRMETVRAVDLGFRRQAVLTF